MKALSTLEVKLRKNGNFMAAILKIQDGSHMMFRKNGNIDFWIQ